MMRHLRFGILLAVVGFALDFPAGAAANRAEKPEIILFLTADGFRTDYIEWYNPTNLKSLIAGGARVLNVKNVFPTVTTPNMTSLVTGSYPRTTGIACNSQYQKEEDRIESKLRLNKAETIAETLKKAGWTTAAVNQFMLAGSRVDFYEDVGYDESEKTTDAVLALLKKARFVAAIYGATDHAGHNHGPKSDAVKKAVESIDHAVGRLIQGLKEMGLYERTLITFNSDHGMSGYEKKQVSAEPAKALKAAGFKVATSQEQLDADTQIVVISIGVRLIYFRKLDEEGQRKATKILSGIEGVEVLGRKELDALGCHDNRSGDLIVNPLPGYTMSNAGGGGGQHGRMAERNPVLFFCGPGIRKGASVESGESVDVVPTLLRVVGVEPARTVDGKALSAVLQD